MSTGCWLVAILMNIVIDCDGILHFYRSFSEEFVNT